MREIPCMTTSRSTQPDRDKSQANYQDGSASTYRPKIYNRHSCLGLRPDNENGVGMVSGEVANSTSPD